MCAVHRPASRPSHHPIRRDHHQQLHQAGNEVAWWHDLDIKALEIAKGLWDESRLKTIPFVEQASREQVPTNPPRCGTPSGYEQITE
jgi:hypothetical protein